MYLGETDVKNIFNLLKCKRDKKLQKCKETGRKFTLRVKEIEVIDIPEFEELSLVCKGKETQIKVRKREETKAEFISKMKEI